MNQLSFQDLELTPGIQRAIDEMGFDTATGIQAETIPLIRQGLDVIGRSQTGTGKTIAFGIPALERAYAEEREHAVRVLILCPTRELAQQVCDELKKLSQFLHGIRIVEVYGGTPMDRQILRLKKADIVVGTPGRVMDHLRRHTLRLNEVELVVLDEADEMLSMGFKEDIETILEGAPESRQTVLFSATMPPAILALTRQFQKDPQLVEIDRQTMVVHNIEQFYVNAPMGRKLDALNLLLRYHAPNRSMIFCNTKKMVDEMTAYLEQNGFTAAGLHGDMNQSQRTKTMDAFKSGRVAILAATDVAARGIDVNDIDYVLNYDIPQNAEYYVHRVGRTGRAGKDGKVITLCSGRRQVETLCMMARLVRAKVEPLEIPTMNEIRQKSSDQNLFKVEAALGESVEDIYTDMVNSLLAKGHALSSIAAAALSLAFAEQEAQIAEIRTVKGRASDEPGRYRRVILSVGREGHVAPNHIVAAVADRTSLSGGDIGKIEIFDDRTIVAVPSSALEEVIDAMQGCKINGRTVSAVAQELKENGGREEETYRRREGGRGAHRPYGAGKKGPPREGGKKWR